MAVGRGGGTTADGELLQLGSHVGDVDIGGFHHVVRHVGHLPSALANGGIDHAGRHNAPGVRVVDLRRQKKARRVRRGKASGRGSSIDFQEEKTRVNQSRQAAKNATALGCKAQPRVCVNERKRVKDRERATERDRKSLVAIRQSNKMETYRCNARGRGAVNCHLLKGCVPHIDDGSDTAGHLSVCRPQKTKKGWFRGKMHRQERSVPQRLSLPALHSFFFTFPTLCTNLGTEWVHDRCRNEADRSTLVGLANSAGQGFAVDADVAVIQHWHLVKNVNVLCGVVKLHRGWMVVFHAGREEKTQREMQNR